MADESGVPLDRFSWEPQPAAAQLVGQILARFCEQSERIGRLSQQLLEETGTRLVDWIDSVVIPTDDPCVRQLADVGYVKQADTDNDGSRWRHEGGIFPPLRVGGGASRLAIKVDAVEDFLSAHRLFEIDVQGQPGGPLRQACAWAENDHELWVVERHGWSGFDLPNLSSADVTAAAQHLDAFRQRPRDGISEEQAFDAAHQCVASAAGTLGTDWACALFFRSEREYWQSRNRAARVQYDRQQRLGMGWANQDHHTYRSSRRHFTQLIGVLEELGFSCRERFYAGQEAGWGAQVLEQPACGIVIFADVDLSPEELADDFAHESLPHRAALGTVGLWCRLHGEAFLAAGMHHLECQFDFDAARQQLAQAGVETMAPFTDFPFLRQAFTAGEQWQVEAARIKSLRADGLITADEAERFRRDGALGSHLEILERNDGYKGFNQTGVSDIIHRTDPRRLSPAGS